MHIISLHPIRTRVFKYVRTWTQNYTAFLKLRLTLVKVGDFIVKTDNLFSENIQVSKMNCQLHDKTVNTVNSETFTRT